MAEDEYLSRYLLVIRILFFFHHHVWPDFLSKDSLTDIWNENILRQREQKFCSQAEAWAPQSKLPAFTLYFTVAHQNCAAPECRTAVWTLSCEDHFIKNLKHGGSLNIELSSPN